MDLRATKNIILHRDAFNTYKANFPRHMCLRSIVEVKTTCNHECISCAQVASQLIVDK